MHIFWIESDGETDCDGCTRTVPKGEQLLSGIESCCGHCFRALCGRCVRHAMADAPPLEREALS